MDKSKKVNFVGGMFEKEKLGATLGNNRGVKVKKQIQGNHWKSCYYARGNIRTRASLGGGGGQGTTNGLRHTEGKK